MDIEKEIRDYIAEVLHLSLATSADNQPWVCEVHFAFDENLNLYFRSLSTRRHSQEIAANPNVSGNIVKQHALNDYPRAVYFEGTAERLGPGTERQEAFLAIKNRLKASDEILAEADQPDGHQFYKITVKNWYIFGKFGDAAGQKYELAWNAIDHE